MTATCLTKRLQPTGRGAASSPELDGPRRGVVAGARRAAARRRRRRSSTGRGPRLKRMSLGSPESGVDERVHSALPATRFYGGTDALNDRTFKMPDFEEV